MKKLSLLVAILLIATVGGVYAAWVYPGADKITANSSKVILLSDDSQAGAEGSYSVISNIDKLTIDPASENDYTAVLNAAYTASGTEPSVQIKFQPNFNSSDDVKENSFTTYVYMDLKVGIDAIDPKFDIDANSGTPDESVFTLKYNKANYIVIDRVDAPAASDGKTHISWVKQPDGSFLASMPFSSIDDVVNMKDNIVLGSLERYNAFLSALTTDRVSLYLHVTSDVADIPA